MKICVHYIFGLMHRIMQYWKMCVVLCFTLLCLILLCIVLCSFVLSFFVFCVVWYFIQFFSNVVLFCFRSFGDVMFCILLFFFVIFWIILEGGLILYLIYFVLSCVLFFYFVLLWITLFCNAWKCYTNNLCDDIVIVLQRIHFLYIHKLVHI